MKKNGWPEWLGFILGMIVWAVVLAYFFALGLLIFRSLWPIDGLPPGV